MKKIVRKIFFYYISFISTANYKIINTDITILLQNPPLSKFKNLIKKNLSKLLKLPENQVSIKATTADKLGFLGREEGIAVFVTTLLVQNGN